MENRWLNVLLDIRDKMTGHNFNTWIKPIKFHSFEDNKITIVVPNKFFKDWIADNFLFIIEDSISTVFGDGCNVGFYIDDRQYKEAEKKTKKEVVKEKKTSKKEELRGSDKTGNINGVLNPKYKFSTFVTGKNNEFSHAAALAVAENDISKYNPLFIYSDVGLGKTHLIQAICHRKMELRKDFKVCYYSSENFTNELINSIRYEKMEEFRNKFRKMDLLLIDDIQFIAGKERTQEEFFHTFNSLYDARKQIVISSDKMPRDIPKLEERLKSRFEWGLIADIQYPDIETKVAILKKKSEAEGVILTNDVAFFISSINEKSNIRELEGYLLRTLIFASLKKCKITLDVAKEALKEFIAIKERIVTIESIQKMVANYYNIKVNDLKSNRKLKQFVKPRHVAMYLCRKLTKASFPEIGEKFGGKDHSTVIYAHKSIEKQMKNDMQLSQHIESIINLLKK
jgi:chromosomal replication initiator protein